MNDRERNIAIKEAHNIAASEAYFEVRAAVVNPQPHTIFDAGFSRGWDAARAAIEAHEARKVPDGWRELMSEALDNALASTVEEGISHDRRAYRRELAQRIKQALDASAPPAPQASVVQEPVQEPLTDEQIKRFGETIGVKVKGWKDYESWGLGYRVDEDGSYTIPNVPDILVPFARAIEAAHGITKEQP